LLVLLLLLLLLLVLLLLLLLLLLVVLLRVVLLRVVVNPLANLAAGRSALATRSVVEAETVLGINLGSLPAAAPEILVVKIL
jgi:hypothetical protein